MSDEIDPDLLKELDLDGPVGGDLGESSPDGIGGPTPDRPSRFVGLLALLLGVIGVLVMAIFAIASIRIGFAASDTVDRAMEPVESAIDRMEARIDESDDLVNRSGIDSSRVDELQARVDGLVDVSTGAHQGFEAVDDHPVYRWLPAALSTLGDELAGFESSAERIDSLLGSSSGGQTVAASAVSGIADELDDMQARVSGLRAMITDAESSLRRWIRLGSFLGLIGSLWGLWGQISLAKRGWKGFRGREL